MNQNGMDPLLRAAVGGGRGQNLAAIYASRSAHLAQQIDLVAHMVVQLGVAWEAAIQRGKGRLLFEHAQQHGPAGFESQQDHRIGRGTSF